MLFCFGISGLVAAFAAVVVGLYGRRLDDHPICGVCGFDLSALPGNQETCPECGSGIRRPEAVRIGNRERRPRLLAVGGVCLVIAGGMLALSAYAHARGIEWIHIKPFNWVLDDAVATSVESEYSDPDVTELIRRYETYSLSAGEIVQLRDAMFAILEHQILTGSTPSPALMPLVDVVLQNEPIPDAYWLSLFVKGTHVTLGGHEHVRIGKPIPLELGVMLGFDRRSITMTPYDMWCDVESLTIDGREVIGANQLGTMRQPRDDIRNRPSVDGTLEWSNPAVRPGPATLKMVAIVTFAVTETPTQKFTMRRTLSREIELVTADATVSPFEAGGELDAINRKAFSDAAIVAWDDHVSVHLVTTDQRPQSLAVEVFLRQGDREYNVGRLYSHTHRRPTHVDRNEHFTAYRGFIGPLLTGKADVILRPSQDVIDEYAGMPQLLPQLRPDTSNANSQYEKWWGGEMVFKDVPIDEPSQVFSFDRSIVARLAEQTWMPVRFVQHDNEAGACRVSLFREKVWPMASYRVMLRAGDQASHADLDSASSAGRHYGEHFTFPLPNVSTGDIVLWPGAPLVSSLRGDTDGEPDRELPMGYGLIFRDVPVGRINSGLAIIKPDVYLPAEWVGVVARRTD